MKIKMRVATQSLISAQVANGGGAPVVELLLCQESGLCQKKCEKVGKLLPYDTVLICLQKKNFVSCDGKCPFFSKYVPIFRLHY